jgi:hypothetical protein
MLRVACAARDDRQAVIEALDHELYAALATAERAGVTKADLTAIEAAAQDEPPRGAPYVKPGVMIVMTGRRRCR